LSLVFERFTESAREVVRNAQTAARELGHAHVGTEHELLGLLADPDSDPSRALSSLGVTADRVRERVLEITDVEQIVERVPGHQPRRGLGAGWLTKTGCTCSTGYRAMASARGGQVFETEHAVIVAVTILDWRGSKTLVGGFIALHATVQLRAPLGDRVVIDDSENRSRPRWTQA
jgi:hypothetical protein